MLPTMDLFPPTKSICLWPDGYWCFRENFHSQPRQNYNYVLVEITAKQWDDLRAGAPFSSLPSLTRPANDATNH